MVHEFLTDPLRGKDLTEVYLQDVSSTSAEWTVRLGLEQLQSMSLDGPLQLMRASQPGHTVVLKVDKAPHLRVGRSPMTSDPDADVARILEVLSAHGIKTVLT